MVLDGKRKAIGCSNLHHQFYPTDVGLPVSLNITEPLFDKKNPTGVAVVSSPTDAIFKADILYEYDALVKAINDNLETLDKYLCIERKHQWAQAVQSGDPDKLAQFVSRDPFAKGEIVIGELHIRNSSRNTKIWDI